MSGFEKSTPVSTMAMVTPLPVAPYLSAAPTPPPPLAAPSPTMSSMPVASPLPAPPEPDATCRCGTSLEPGIPAGDPAAVAGGACQSSGLSGITTNPLEERSDADSGCSVAIVKNPPPGRWAVPS